MEGFLVIAAIVGFIWICSKISQANREREEREAKTEKREFLIVSTKKEREYKERETGSKEAKNTKPKISDCKRGRR